MVAGQAIDQEGLDFRLQGGEPGILGHDGLPGLQPEQRLHRSRGAGINGDDLAASFLSFIFLSQIFFFPILCSLLAALV